MHSPSSIHFVDLIITKRRRFVDTDIDVIFSNGHRINIPRVVTLHFLLKVVDFSLNSGIHHARISSIPFLI